MNSCDFLELLRYCGGACFHRSFISLFRGKFDVNPSLFFYEKGTQQPHSMDGVELSPFEMYCYS